MLAIVMSLLGGGLGFFKKYWKYIAIVAVVLGLIFWHQHEVKLYGQAQFKAGVDATLIKMKDEVSKRNTLNRAIENRLQTGVDVFSTNKQKEKIQRDNASQTYKDKLSTVVDTVKIWNSETCSITPQILADRNAIRALGPISIIPAIAPITPIIPITGVSK